MDMGLYAIQTIMLPKIELLKFDKSVIEWHSFRNIFQSLVYNNLSIINFEWFHYLIYWLSGPALAVVKGVPLTTDNYTIL